MLPDDQRPNLLNTGCPGAASDSTDPLAQFLPERADASGETDRAPRSSEGDYFLLPFESETAATDASTTYGGSGYRRPSALARVLATTVLSWIRVATRSSLGLRDAMRELRDAADQVRAYLVPGLARLGVRATAWGFALGRRLRSREGPRQQFAALSGGTVRAALRRIAATSGAAGQGRSTAQSHRWTYPASFFLSGAAAGAFLVTVVRVPADNSVVAQVSAQPSARVAAANYIAAERPAAPAPALTPPPQIDQRVSTSGLTAKPLEQSAVQGSVAVSARTVRNRPPSFVGSISINSSPQGADVFLNGRRVGTTPLVMPQLPVGSRAVRLTMSGYSTWSRAVQVVADRRTTISATLEQMQQ